MNAKRWVLGLFIVALVAGAFLVGRSVGKSKSPKTIATTTTSLVATSTSSAVSTTARLSSCGARDFSATSESLGGAAGTTGTKFALTNISGRSCTVNGYPGFTFVDSSGGSLAISVKNGTGMITSIWPKPSAIIVIPHEKIYFALAISTDNNGACQSFSAYRVTLPGDTGNISISSTGQICATASGPADVSVSAFTNKPPQ